MLFIITYVLFYMIQVSGRLTAQLPCRGWRQRGESVAPRQAVDQRRRAKSNEDGVDTGLFKPPPKP